MRIITILVTLRSKLNHIIEALPHDVSWIHHYIGVFCAEGWFSLLMTFSVKYQVPKLITSIKVYGRLTSKPSMFFQFQNAGRQRATGDDSLTDYCVKIYQSISTDIYHRPRTHFLLDRALTVLFGQKWNISVSSQRMKIFYFETICLIRFSKSY